MPSIFDPSFKLPLIEPLRKNARFDTGANKPLLITGVNRETGEKDDYVVKLLRSERLTTSAFMRELLASFVAMELDIFTASPAVIDIKMDFVEVLRGDEDFARAQQSLGYNFGTRYIDKFLTLAVHQPLPETVIFKALDIFAFDVFVQNADRSHEVDRKPNILTDGKELLIFDHEMAFGFALLLPSARNREPWNISDNDKLWIEKHCLFHKLKGKKVDGPELEAKFSCINDEFWARAWDLIPESWKDKEQFDLIKEFLSQIVLNRNTFVRNLQLLLA